MKLNYFLLFCIIISNLYCSKVSIKETVYEDFEKVEKITIIKEINTNILVKSPHIYLCNNIFIVNDPYNNTKCVHLYNRVSFQFLCSTAIVGEGPSEIGGAGPMLVDETENCFWLVDFSKFKMFKYPIDSILQNPQYLPTFSYQLPYGQCFTNYTF